MAASHLFASIPVADRDAAVGWYELLAGRPPDLVPNPHEAAWRMSESGWIYVIVDPGRAGAGLSTLLVGDLDAFISEVEGRGIAAAEPETLASGTRVTTITDPDGNRLQVGELREG